MDRSWSRRAFLRAAAQSALAPTLLASCRSPRGDSDAKARDRGAGSGGREGAAAGEAFFRTRGVVLVPDDLSLADWPERAHAAGLTTIGLHHGGKPSLVVEFVRSDRGQRFLADCRRLGLQVEYELHAMRELLPRELVSRNPEFFRMNEKGDRTNDVNLCVHSERALDLVATNALALDEKLKPTTHRRFFWGDDGAPWCRCSECALLSESEQALIVENCVLKALRRIDRQAALAHLSYANTLAPPKQVKPEPGVFLEFAPLEMRFRRPLVGLGDPSNSVVLAQLDGNLAVFPRETAQALEYWLDDSMYSNWKKPAQELRWSDEVFAADVELYAARGVRNVTSFAVYIDQDYVARFGFPRAIQRYGEMLAARRS